MAPQSLEDQAAEWLARLDRTEASAPERAAFEAWRAADPKHDAACLRLEIGWQRFERLQALRPPRGMPDPKLLAASGFVETDVPAPASLPDLPVGKGRPLAWAASIAAVSIGIAAYVVLDSRPIGNLDYATRVGEYRRIVLDDQSVVELDTATRLNVRLTPQARNLELLQGQARFTVARDPQRPFVVDAGETRVQALGTAFTVRREDNIVDVLVTEGRVAVNAKSSQPQIVAAGERAAARLQKVQVERVAPQEVARSLAWQEGMLAFEGAALEEVVAEFNRYNQTRLTLADPELGSLRIGGYFRATAPDALIATLGRSFGIRAERAGTEEIRLSGPARP